MDLEEPVACGRFMRCYGPFPMLSQEAYYAFNFEELSLRRAGCGTAVVNPIATRAQPVWVRERFLLKGPEHFINFRHIHAVVTYQGF